MTAVGCLPHGASAIQLQTLLYFSAAVLGFLVVIPVGVTLRNFHGACILFAEIVSWKRYTIWPWNEPSCLYVLYVNLAINVFYSTFMGFVNTILYSKKVTDKKTSYLQSLLDWNISYILRAFNPVFLIINFCIMFFEVAGASILTSGLADFCNRTETFVNRMPDKSVIGLEQDHYYKCSELSGEDNFWGSLSIARGTTKGVRGHSFYGCLVVAAIASWLLFLIWMTHFVLNVLMTCRVCSCDVAEEKRKGDKTSIIAQRRSRLATPIATPGGMLTPSRGLAAYPPVSQYGGSSYIPVPQSPQPETFDPSALSRPPASPAESATPPKADLSYPQESISPPSITVLPTPKSKKLYTKKSPQSQAI